MAAQSLQFASKVKKFSILTHSLTHSPASTSSMQLNILIILVL
jgi:hypothetical protein